MWPSQCLHIKDCREGAVEEFPDATQGAEGRRVVYMEAQMDEKGRGRDSRLAACTEQYTMMRKVLKEVHNG
jgi:hypothetical protein